MKKNRSFGMNIGTSSILVIVVILTLVCFAGLSLASSNADYQLCKKLADRTTAYYNATSMAYETLADETTAGKSSDNEKEPSYKGSFKINDSQVLKVNAILNPADGSNYILTSFDVVNVETPKLDTDLSLLLN